MVLSVLELKIAQSEVKNKRISSMLRLRENTSSFLIQCLADREIQKLISDEQNTNSKAYGYNCTVIHNPHAWSHFSAVNGHGWNANSNQPHDPNLKIGKVLANQHSNGQADNIKVDKKTLELLEASNRKVCQLEETITILKEENAKIKELCITSVNKDKNSNMSDNQHILSLQQQIRTINSNLEDKKQTIKSLNSANLMLQSELFNERTYSEETIRNLRVEKNKLAALKSEVEIKNQTIQRLNNHIVALQVNLAAERNRGRDAHDSLIDNDVEPASNIFSRLCSTLSKCCCLDY